MIAALVALARSRLLAPLRRWWRPENETLSTED